MENVKKSTRASKRGTAIFCPHCSEVGIVYSFNWSSAQCNRCKKQSAKTQFLMDENIPKLAKIVRKLSSIEVITELIEWLLSRTPKNSIIDQTKESINDTSDYALCLNFQNAFISLEPHNLGNTDRFKVALWIILHQHYKKAESNDIGELRKQKLLKIEKAEN
jgi:hypothetical protein